LKTAAASPIGIFDSGIGGLTVAGRIIRDFPTEDIIYFGDTAHLPYGDKSEELIRQYSRRISEFLIDEGCKLIVIACNTASSVAYEELNRDFSDKAFFVNVVDPAARGISKMKGIKDIGIIGTQRTISSNIYAEKLNQLRPDIRVHSLATPLLAPMIEAGFINHQISEAVIETYLTDDTLKPIEALILACTHYPLIKMQIESFYKGRVQVFDSTDFISEEIGAILDLHHLHSEKRTRKDRFYVSDLTETFEKTTRHFFKGEIELKHYPLWENQKSSIYE
jgi:glutamate racemase